MRLLVLTIVPKHLKFWNGSVYGTPKMLSSVQEFFLEEIFQFSYRIFFSFPDTTRGAQTYARSFCRTVSSLKDTGVLASLQVGTQR